MLILLSPAKTLDMQSASRVDKPSVPHFTEEPERLIKTLRRYSKKELSELMHISDNLTELNAQRYKQWQAEIDPEQARPAIEAFRGDVYVGLDVDTLGKRDLSFAQNHLRILSGLYGVLRPFDLMQAHRLEMGTSLKTRSGKSLYDFWGSSITDYINTELDQLAQPLLVNLASNEYFKSVKKKELSSPAVSPVFKDEKNGNYKVISFFAKKARGAMARHLIKTRATSLDNVLEFDALGYQHDPEQSSEALPVFIRSEKAAQSYLA